MASAVPNTAQSKHETQRLDLSTWPPIYVSNTHFEIEELHELEDDLTGAGALLTYDINEAQIVLSKVLRKPRIILDLKSKGLYTSEASLQEPSTKKRKRIETGPDVKSAAVVIDLSTDSEADSAQQGKDTIGRVSTDRYRSKSSSLQPEAQEQHAIKVVRVEWFADSKRAGHLLPINNYVTYHGIRVQALAAAETLKSAVAMRAHDSREMTQAPAFVRPPKPAIGNDILQRAKEDSPAARSSQVNRFGRRKFGLSVPSANPSSWEAGHGKQAKYAHLLVETTTEHDEGLSSDIPEAPEWVRAGIKYACQRSTPKDNPNDDFINLLKKIKLARLLTNDQIGVRAYSTSIASIAAYSYKFSHPREIQRLPGCNDKLANLWVEWKNTGKIKAVEDLEADQDLKVLRTFYDIWGVGVTTARQFYYDKGWTDLDDIIENGWDVLERVQKIGVKYYDEFLDLIPRAELEEIGETIRRHAVKVRDEDIQMMIVGGYRRGKEASGDVDVVVSHFDERATANLVEDIVDSLEMEGWITHTLTISLNSTKRGQQTLPFRADGGGHGFDTLDKALVVWQDPTWPTKDRDLAQNPKAKNPNIHRRVDIIISPWRTVGCAVVGWSGGTTFERDLRRYAKNTKGWKFDSSGVRNRGNGEVVDVEGYYSWKGKEGLEARARTMEEAERRVFEGFELQYRAPTERCTG